MENDYWKNVILTALTPIVWGTTYFVTTEFLPQGRPLFGAMMRALPVGLLILLYARKLPEGKWWYRVFILGGLNIGLFFALLFTAAYRLPGGIASSIGAIQPFVVAILAQVFIGELITRRKVLSALAGALGVGMIVIGPQASFDVVGIAAAFAATTSMATGTVLTKRWGQPAPLIVFTAWQLVAGGLILVPLAISIEGMPSSLSTTNISGFLYLGLIGTGMTYALWFRGIQRLKASTVTFLALLSPVSAMTIDFLILGRALTGAQLAGAVLVIGAVVTAQITLKRNSGNKDEKNIEEKNNGEFTRTAAAN